MKLAEIASWLNTKQSCWSSVCVSSPSRLQRLLEGAAVSIGAIAMAVGVNLAYMPMSLAPEVKVSSKDVPELRLIDSLDDLYRLRDRLQHRLGKQAVRGRLAAHQSTFVSLTPEQHQLYALNIRIHNEEQAQQLWDESLARARQAVKLGKKSNLTPRHLSQMTWLWQQAIARLSLIPADSLLAEQAATRREFYLQQLEDVAYRYDTMRSEFLKPLVEATGISASRFHVTVCQVETRECRRLNGKEPTASPASLIKVPVAVALMDKVIDENLSLDEPIQIESQNYTEDASDIWVGTDYSLRHVLHRMINQSSNIATNQLIDFISFDYIETMLEERGYDVTAIGSKLAGDRILPVGFKARGVNRISTDELTEMMVRIYSLEHPGDQELIHALATQTDTRMGKSAIRGEGLIWLGEKTGWNSRVVGTTVAAEIAEDPYVITVALDYSGSVAAVERVVQDIATHILEHQGL